MIPTATVDTREFSAAIRQLSGGVRKKAALLANQWTLDIAGEWFDRMPPPVTQIAAKRQEIRNYLRARVGANTRKGKPRRKGLEGTKRTPLMRMNLIIQARRARSGLRGLYGPEMKAYAGLFASRAQNSVGYLKVILLPVIRGLNRVMRSYQKSGTKAYVKAFAETGGGGKISIWPGSKGYGKVTPAITGNPFTLLNLRWSLHGPREAYARGLVMTAMRQAIDFKLGKVRRQMERELQTDFNRVNTRVTST